MNNKPNIKLIEYKKGSINPFTTLTRLADIWMERREKAISSIDRFNENKSTGKIFLVLLEEEVIGITGYYLIDKKDDFIGLRWHGIVLEHQKQGYSKKALELLIEEIKNKNLSAKYIQELLPIDKIDTLSYFEKIGFMKTDDEAKIYDEMPDVKCLKLIKSLL